MFFAETLGPVLTQQTTQAMFKFVKSRLTNGCTQEDLRAAVSEFLRIHHIKADPDAMIELLARGGYVAFSPAGPAAGRQYEIAA